MDLARWTLSCDCNDLAYVLCFLKSTYPWISPKSWWEHLTLQMQTVQKAAKTSASTGCIQNHVVLHSVKNFVLYLNELDLLALWSILFVFWVLGYSCFTSLLSFISANFFFFISMQLFRNLLKKRKHCFMWLIFFNINSVWAISE